MSALVLVGLLLVGAKPSQPVSLPMPPPPAAKPKPPPEPAPDPAPPPPPAAKAEAPKPAAGTLLSKIRISGGLGPAFTLGEGVAPLGSTPVWLRGSLRATLDLAHLGPGELQILAPISVQGTGFRQTVFGFLVAGSLFGTDVMPSVRYQAEVMKDLALFAELGLGFAFYQVTLQQQFTGYQTAGASGFGVRVGAGVEYQLLDQLRLLIQPMEVTSLTVSSTVTQNGMTVTTTTGTSQWSMLFGAVVPL